MTILTTTILFKIKSAVANQQQYIPASNVELIQAVGYIDDLVSNTTDLETIEKSMIRFIRIRPKQFNVNGSPISIMHDILVTFNMLPDTPQTAEEKLLSEFLVNVFTHVDANTALVYKTVANVEPGITQLTKLVSSIDWEDKAFLTGNTRLHHAVASKNIPMITLLLAVGANIYALNRSNISPLDSALSSENDDIILRFVTQPGITLSESNKSKLLKVFYEAVCTENLNLITAILSIHNLDRKTLINTPNHDGRSCLNQAAMKGHKAITKILLDNGADANLIHLKNSPLSLVAGRKKEERKPEHRDIAVFLLAGMTPASVNAATQAGLSALAWAFDSENRDIAELLVQFEGIDLSTTFTNGENALIGAIANGWDDIVAIILSKNDGKKLVNSVDDDGFTPLHYAAFHGKEAIVKMLLDHGANANVTNFHQDTPLVLVAGRNHDKQMPEDPAIVSLLLEAMIPDAVNLWTKNNLSALGWAVKKLNPAIVQLLVQYKGTNLDELFNDKTIDQVAIDNNWTDVTHALNIRKSVEAWLDNNEKDTLENRVRDLTQTVNEKNEEIERLNKRIEELEAKTPAASVSTAVGIPVRPSVDTSVKYISTNSVTAKSTHH